MRQPYIFIVIFKQWKQYLMYILILLITLLILWGAYLTMNQSFKIPVTVQDQDRTVLSRTLIKEINANEYIEVEKVPTDEAYLDEYVSRKSSVVSIQIPKGYHEQLRDNHLNSAILLYARDDFIGNITMEMISRSLYEQQIPNIVKAHLDEDKEKVTLAQVNDTLKNKKPHSKIAHYAVKHHSDTSISLSIVFAILLTVGSVQVLLQQRLKQNGPLMRMYMFQYSKLNLYVAYICAHTTILITILAISALFFQQNLSIIFYLKSLVLIVIYEFGLAWLLFKVNTFSHRLFMILIYALVMSTIYIFIQL